MNISRLVREDIAKLVFERENYPYQSHEISLETAVKHVQKYCKQSLNQYMGDNILYRKINSESPALYGNPANFNRNALSGDNALNFILDTSPYWADFPKRSKSFFMTPDATIAEGYGSSFGSSLYACFPYDNANMGVGLVDVVAYETSPPYKVNLENLVNYCMKASLYLAKIYLPEDYEKSQDFGRNGIFSYEEIKYCLSLVDKAKSTVNYVEELAATLDLPEFKRRVIDVPKNAFYILQNCLYGNHTMLETLYEVSEPEAVKSIVITPNEIDHTNGYYEVWTDSPCVFINLKNIPFKSKMSASKFLSSVEDGFNKALDKII